MIDLRRYALGAVAMVAVLAGCGGNANNGVVPASSTPNSLPHDKTFHHTGRAQDFKVPAGVTQITVLALGAHGAGSPAAYGGRVHAVIPVTPGETLLVFVGGDASGTGGGFNGGGNGGDEGSYAGTGGGGASDVREGGRELSDRVLVAGGGGGQGGSFRSTDGLGGGGGGGRTGGSGTGGSSGYIVTGGAGGGGTQKTGGTGGSGGEGYGYGNPGQNGSVGKGGDGGSGCVPTSSCITGFGGGGGGGGYYGGGGGGAGGNNTGYPGYGGGAGGGSGYVESSARDVHMRRGWKRSARNGLVVLSW